MTTVGFWFIEYFQDFDHQVVLHSTLERIPISSNVGKLCKDMMQKGVIMLHDFPDGRHPKICSLVIQAVVVQMEILLRS